MHQSLIFTNGGITYKLFWFSYRDGHGKCALCNSVIGIKDDPFEHREECARENHSILDTMPTTQVKCSKCPRMLKKWPQNLPPSSFHCKLDACPLRDDSESPQGPRMKNDGTNLFMCFQCDFKACSMCVVRITNSNQLDQSVKPLVNLTINPVDSFKSSFQKGNIFSV